MTLEQIIAALNLNPLTQPAHFERVHVTQGYASDLLSRVLAEAPHQAIWVTLQAHVNVVAVAAVLELSAVIITSGSRPDDETIARANQEGMPLLLTETPTFQVVGQLWDLGVR